MNTETQYALLSDYVYSRSAANNEFDLTKLIPGAVPILTMTVASSGFYAEAWTIGGKTVIAFRGTDFNAQSITISFTQGNDGLAWGNVNTAQLQNAIAFVQQVKQQTGATNLVFTGHSLGGGLAGLMAAKYGQPAYVFAPAPPADAGADPLRLSGVYGRAARLTCAASIPGAMRHCIGMAGSYRR